MIVFKYSIKSEWIYFLLGEIACIAVIIIFSLNGIKKNRFFDFISKYTLPIYLMHTIFAATLRAILLKLGIVNGFIHIVVGISISFLGPIVVTEIMYKIKYSDFFLYPGKYIKLK